MDLIGANLDNHLKPPECGYGWAGSPNPLLRALETVEKKIERFKGKARDFYFQVMLSAHACGSCGGRLEMIGRSLCRCQNCQCRIDPTLEFQRSLCCGVELVRRPAHYVCSHCKRITPSRFLFDERVFDRNYFREMMQTSRERARSKREAIRQLLAKNRSEELVLTEEPELKAIPGLVEALNIFLSSGAVDLGTFQDIEQTFDMETYRRHILECLGWGNRPFSAIPLLQPQPRLDRVFRFITLVFMAQSGEVTLEQAEGEILVQRIYHEAYE